MTHVAFRPMPVRLCLCVVITLAVFVYPTIGQDSSVPGRWVVRLSDPAPAFDRMSAAGIGMSIAPLVPPANAAAFRSDIDPWSRYLVVTAEDTGLTRRDIAARLAPLEIDYIEPDYELVFFDRPADPLFTNQWYLENTGQPFLGVNRRDGAHNDQQEYKFGLPGADINAAPLYDAPPEEKTKVVVAIIDTGVDLKHPDLQGQFWRNTDELPGNGLDDDHNGYVDDTLGFDISGDIRTLTFPVGDNDVTDSSGHGTHLAGIVAARADAQGVIGVAPSSEIMTLKIRPNGSSSVGAAAIVYAVRNGAQVINLSWGTPFEALVLTDALNYAREQGVFVAVAAGNSGTNERFYPAAFDNVFTVGAGNAHGFMTSFSTFGSHVDIVAPGEDILSLRAAGTDLYAAGGEPNVHIVGDDLRYYLSDGTSMAAPIVAGVAARLLAIRPDLGVTELETALRLGAEDMIDPRNLGDTLIGPDTLSGAGYVKLTASLNLLTSGALAIVSPPPQARLTTPTDIILTSLAGYSGHWSLECGAGLEPSTWLALASGATFDPSGAEQGQTSGTVTITVRVPFDQPGMAGLVTLRASFGNSQHVLRRIWNVPARKLELTAPADNEDLKFTAFLRGSAFGPDFDSLRIVVSRPGQSGQVLFRDTREYFDTLLYAWNISGVDTGAVTFVLTGYFASGEQSVSRDGRILWAYADGWPQFLPGRGSLTPVACDLDNDGVKELIVGTLSGLYGFSSDGSVLPNFPFLPEQDMRCVPAFYDVDNDGYREIITTNSEGIHVFRRDGTSPSGWPKRCHTGVGPYGCPNPIVTQFTPYEPPVIAIINTFGQVLAYELNGDSYFYSLAGRFASFNSLGSQTLGYGNNSLAVADVDGDSLREVAVAYSSLQPRSGVELYDGRTARTAQGRPSPHIIDLAGLYGAIMADLTGDGLPEIIAVGYNNAFGRRITATTMGGDPLPGWPIELEGLEGWRANYPVVADLDLDGSPEVILTIFEIDAGALFIFRADGSPYRQRLGGPYGEVRRDATTFGTPMVANLVGDSHPEIVFRTGYLLPGTGNERIFLLDHLGDHVPGWPVATSAPTGLVISSPYAPLIDDLDGDGLVEMALTGDANLIFVWNFDAPYLNGQNRARLLFDDQNTNVHWPIPGGTTGTAVRLSGAQK